MVYAKPPFAGAQQVLDYVGRYTHRVAISNNRLLDIEDGRVQSRYKDYRTDNLRKIMTVSADEFIRRFLLHVLPNGFQRIRYYGFLGNRYRERKLARCRQLLGINSAKGPAKTSKSQDYRDRYQELTGVSLWLCPVCHRGRMFRVDLPAAVCTSQSSGGHFMRMLSCQWSPPQICRRQIHGEVSPDAPPSAPAFFLSGSARCEPLFCDHRPLRDNYSSRQTTGFPSMSQRFNTHRAGRIEAV